MPAKGRPKSAPLTDPLLLAWEERLHRTRRSPRTIINYRQAARHYENYLSALGIPAVKAESWVLEEFFAGLDYMASTKRRYLVDIGAAYRYGITRRVIDRDPTKDVQIERVPDSEPTIVPNVALREMKKRIYDDSPWICFHLLAYAGLRRNEARNLMRHDVHLADQTLRVMGKGGKLRLVPIHPALGEVLADLKHVGPYVVPSVRAGSPVSEQTFRTIVRTFTTEYVPHDFRRTVASSLYRNGVETDTIDRIMGWAAREVRSRYYVNVAGDQLQRAIMRLYADDPV